MSNTSTTPTKPTPTIKTRILIISDTHTASLAPSSENVSFRHPLPKADVLLHCGDLTQVGKLWEYQKTLDMLRDCDAELKLVIAGNHDISLDEKFYKRRGRGMQSVRAEEAEAMPKLAREMWMGERARLAGVTYLEEGTYEFRLKLGARLRVYASPYQPEFCDWAFPYFRHEDRFNSPSQAVKGAVSIVENPVPDFPAIDVMMTHGPPMGCLDETYTGDAVGCEHLLRAAKRCRPRLHCFGHIHEGWGAERVKWSDDGRLGAKWEELVEDVEDVDVDMGKLVEERAVMVDVTRTSETPLVFGKETLMVNASIMNLAYSPTQGPWIVDLDLEKVDEKGADQG